MNEIKLLKRKLVLKKQALKLFAEKVEELKDRLALLKIQQRTEGRMKENFDPAISRRLDAVNVLLEKGADNG
jgi:hypothetical protein